tara:strand:- start:153 stop:683 length:531 start_codon:yes stop_codon:yes gene_type:complete
MTITRAMKRVAFVQNTLTTPGIVTQIAKQLLLLNDEQENRADGKIGIISLYFIMNNEQLRFELDPFMDVIRNTVIKNQMIQKSHIYIIDVSLANNSIKKSKLVLQLFKYLCGCGDDLYLLGKTCAYLIGIQLDIIIDQAYENSKLSHIVPKLKEYKKQLHPFLSWGEDERYKRIQT